MLDHVHSQAHCGRFCCARYLSGSGYQHGDVLQVGVPSTANGCVGDVANERSRTREPATQDEYFEEKRNLDVEDEEMANLLAQAPQMELGPLLAVSEPLTTTCKAGRD